MTLVYLMKDRKETVAATRELTTRVQRNFGRSRSKIKCENADEYLRKALLKLFEDTGTDIAPTVPHSPQENAVAERLNRTLVARVRATLDTAKLPLEKYWAFCLLDTVTKANSVVHDATNNIHRRLLETARHKDSPFPATSVNLSWYRMFGEYGFIPGPARSHDAIPSHSS